MIYDRNQFIFNIILSVLMVVLISAFVFFGFSVLRMEEKLDSLEKSRNNIQASHQEIGYVLGQGVFTVDADDFGKLTGASMQPAIFDGNTLIEMRYSNQTIVPGHVVRYIDAAGTPVIHRVRAVYEGTLHVQGDSMGEGEIIEKSQITHVVLGVLYT